MTCGVCGEPISERPVAVPVYEGRGYYRGDDFVRPAFGSLYVHAACLPRLANGVVT